MRWLERTQSGLDTKRTTHADREEVERWRCGSISAATAAGGMTSRNSSAKRWERPQDGKRADAGMCKSLSFSP